MKKFIKLILGSLIIATFSFVSAAGAETVEKKPVCATYLTGIGCPHCALVDPVLLDDVLEEFPNLIIVEYEVYQDYKNNNVILYFNDLYNSGFGIPNIIFGENDNISGDKPILDNIESMLEEKESNKCPLTFGEVDAEGLGFVSFTASPKIWRYNRVLYPEGSYSGNQNIASLLFANDIEDALTRIDHKAIEPEEVPYSGGSFTFDYAVEVDGWVMQWNDWREPDVVLDIADISDFAPIAEQLLPTKLTLTKLVSLAVVDAVNPCALAVLTLMLIAILAYHPENKKKVLLAGLAFSFSVFLMYLIYGLVIVKFFQFIQLVTDVRLILYKILGVIAILLGLLNIKDTLWYKPGGVATEMPMFMRGRLKRTIARVTSPVGALFVGIFVTIFLLPCTIGPYVVAGGILSAMDLIRTIPPLLLYNLIFVLPMLIITGVVYFGMTRVENVSEWKDKNIRYLHLFAGIVMLALGILMVLGWV